MFYIPVKLRQPKRLVTPSGPNLRWTIRNRVKIAGTELSFKVPRHRPKRSYDEATYPEHHYPQDRLPMRVNFAARRRKKHLSFHRVFYHAWAFCGPWFTGVLGELCFTITLFRLLKPSRRFSLFHPRTMEMVIGDYLDYMYAHRFSVSGPQSFMAPVNWQPLNHLSVHAVRFEVVPQAGSGTQTTEHFVFFPLADDLMVRCRFEPSRFLNLPNEQLDKLIDIQPMHDLMNDIINNIQVKLSPEAQAQQAKALEGLADRSLVREFAPIKWDKLSEKATAEALRRNEEMLQAPKPKPKRI